MGTTPLMLAAQVAQGCAGLFVCQYQEVVEGGWPPWLEWLWLRWLKLWLLLLEQTGNWTKNTNQKLETSTRPSVIGPQPGQIYERGGGTGMVAGREGGRGHGMGPTPHSCATLALGIRESSSFCPAARVLPTDTCYKAMRGEEKTLASGQTSARVISNFSTHTWKNGQPSLSGPQRPIEGRASVHMMREDGATPLIVADTALPEAVGTPPFGPAQHLATVREGISGGKQMVLKT